MTEDAPAVAQRPIPRQPTRRPGDRARRDRARRSPRSSSAGDPRSRPFLERYRGRSWRPGLVAGLVLVGGFVFAAADLADLRLLDPVQAQRHGRRPRPGRRTTWAGSTSRPARSSRYTFCPPASGKHVNRSRPRPDPGPRLRPRRRRGSAGLDPQPRARRPRPALPLRRAAPATTPARQPLKPFATDFPPSPICQPPAGRDRAGRRPVRADAGAYAALVWDRVLYLDTLDTAAILRFYTRRKASAATRSRSAPAPSPSPSASPSAAPSASPEPSPS